MKQTFLAKSALSILLLSQIADALATTEQSSFPFKFSPQAGIEVTIDQPSGSEVIAQLPKGKKQTLAVVETFEASDAVNNIALVDDFNFDGAQDLALLESVGYGGVNLFYHFYLWDKNTQELRDYGDAISNPQLDTQRQLLNSSERSGPMWSSTRYRAEQGKLYPAVLWEAITVNDGNWQRLTFKDVNGRVLGHKVVNSQDEQSGDAGDNLPNVVATIKVKKAALYDKPTESSKTKMYLIKKDQVTLLDWQATEGDPYAGMGWFLVRYEGKKTLEKWLEGTAFIKP